jgi:cell division protein FtsQ
MKNLKKISLILGVFILILAGVFGIVSATMNQNSKRCKGINIKIEENVSQTLVSNADIKRWATNFGNEPLEGKVISQIDLKKIEKRVLASGFVKNCEAYFDVKGNINLNAKIHKPIARILLNGLAEDKLLSDEGKIFPRSHKYSPTLLLIGGSYFQNFSNHKAKKNADIVELVNKICNDDFWQAQITQISIDDQKEITLYPLLGKQNITFGKPEKIDSKLEKLMVFYTKILPMSQWSNFETVNLKYDSQIVCK